MIIWKNVLEEAFFILSSFALFLVFLFFIVLMGAALFKLVMGIFH